MLKNDEKNDEKNDADQKCVEKLFSFARFFFF